MDRVPLQHGTIDLAHGVLVCTDGVHIRLTTKERDLLAFLVAHPSKELSRSELLAEVWGYHPDTHTRALDTTVKGLRRKIERDPKQPHHVITVWGVGYRFEPLTDVPASDGFVGRHEELAVVRSVLNSDTPQAVIVGIGGVGKTRLVLEATRSIPATVFVPLDEVDDGSQIPAAVARHLPPSDLPLPVRLRRLRGPLLLDNAEHVADALAEWLGEWLSDAPQLALLVTSRVPVPLPDATAIGLGVLAADEGVELLRDRLRRAQPRHSIEEGQLRALADRLDGLPLAIELVGSRASVLGINELLGRASELLGQPAFDGTMSLADTMRSSFELLEEDQRETLVACALFRAPFTASDVEATVGRSSVIDELGALGRVHLLDWSTATERLLLLPTIRAAVLALGSPSVEQWSRHTAHVLACAAAGPDDDTRWLSDLEDLFRRDLSPATVASIGLEIVRRSRRFTNGKWLQATSDRLVACAMQAGDADGIADALSAACIVGLRLGTLAPPQARNAVAAAEASGSSARLLWALAHLGAALRFHADHDEALAVLQRAMSLDDASCPLSYRLLAGLELGMVHRAMGDLEAARQVLEVTTRQALEAGQPWAEAVSMHRLGTTLGLIGRFRAAWVWLDRCDATAAANGFEALRYQASMTRAFLEQECGELVATPTTFGLPIEPDLEHWFHSVMRHGHQSLVHTQRNELPQAAEASERAFAACRGSDRGPAWAFAWLTDGIWRMVAGDPGAVDGFRHTLRCGDAILAIYAHGYLRQLEPEHELPPDLVVPAGSVFEQFLAVARAPVPPADLPQWGQHARILAQWRQGQ